MTTASGPQVPLWVPGVDKIQLRIYIGALFLPVSPSHTNPTESSSKPQRHTGLYTQILQAEGKERSGLFVSFVGRI